MFTYVIYIKQILRYKCDNLNNKACRNKQKGEYIHNFGR